MFIWFEQARPAEDDARIVMEWRNDPQTMQMSYRTSPRTWDVFRAEYMETYFTDADLPPLFAMVDNMRVGFLRFLRLSDDVLGASAVEIGINIAPSQRGKGLGSQIIRRATERLFRAGFESVLAEIRQVNTASVRAFEKAGYLFHDTGSHTVMESGEVVPIFRYVARRPTAPSGPLARRRVFIIGEAGSNWRCGTPARDLLMAKALIDAAAEAGVDAVKFQTYRAETVYVPNAGTSDYLAESGIRESIVDIFRDQAMPYDMLPHLAEHCKARGVQFMSTPFSLDDAAAVDPHVAIHKLASYEISHPGLIAFLAATGKPLVFSTGAATEDDIAWALAHFYVHGGRDARLLQCTARYPAPLTALNLSSIPALRDRFGVPVGLSDHSRDPVVGPVAAVALGATILEKHFTLHNRLPGADHAFALTPPELAAMVKAVRDAEQTLGPGSKVVLREEAELRAYAQRAVQATRDIAAGETLVLGGNIDVLRPGRRIQGAHPRFLAEIQGKRATRPIAMGDGIRREDYA